MITVTVYSTPTCPYCQKAKEFLKKNNVAYKDINVADNNKAREEMIKKTGQMGVPVIEIGKDIIIGFDKEELQKKLRLENKR
ncbi:glutathione S-transferase N-terminal domain-containing protein [Candidatus Woesearchaeota archaeon]|nr:glutathione S-transferase N-terminal domain-containing protein [Candidatus Woesearchaeota archaeon]